MSEENKKNNNLLLILLLIIIGGLIFLNFFQNKSQIDLAIKSLELAQEEIKNARMHVDSARHYTAELKSALNEYKGYVDSATSRVEKINSQRQTTNIYYKDNISEKRESYKKLKKELMQHMANSKTVIEIDTLSYIR